MTATSPVRGIRLHPIDDVAITTHDAAAGMPLDAGGTVVILCNDVPRGHKVALRDIAQGNPVRRYGQVIGFAGTGIAAGEHVHVHNLRYQEFEREYQFCTDARTEKITAESEQATFQGYLRSDGKVGTRNYLGIL